MYNTKEITENINVTKIENLSEKDYDVEIENYLKEAGFMTPTDMAFATRKVIGSQPFKSPEERIQFVAEKCKVFQDEKYIYVCAAEKDFSNIAGTDIGVQRFAIKG